MESEPSPVTDERRRDGEAPTQEQRVARNFARLAGEAAGIPASLRDRTLESMPAQERDMVIAGVRPLDLAPAMPVDLAPAMPAPRAAKRSPHAFTRTSNFGDRLFNLVTSAFAAFILLVVVAMLVILIWQGHASIEKFGFGFLTSSRWDTIHDVYGAAPAILGTVYTSLLALLIAAPIGILVAVFLTEIAPRRIRFSLGFVVELLAALPSIVFGLWALFVLVPLVARYLQPWFLSHFGNTPFFSGAPIGLGYLTASLILAIMILPTITAISRDVLLAVPNSQRDAMLALGATRWETTWRVIVPYALTGIIGAVILALGRAIGETMAVQMVIGNTLSFNISLFATGTTMPATIVNQFAEASTPMYRSALIEIALILMIVTILLNAVARVLVLRVGSRKAG